MRDFVVSVKKGKLPLYLRITASIREAVRKGLVLPGEQLPSCRTLARQIGANRHTVMAALDQLIAEGWVHAEARKGYRVVGEQPSSFFTPKISNAVVKPRSPPLNASSSSQTAIKWDFRGGTSDLRLFPFDELKTCLNEALRRNAPALLGYGDPTGHAPFIHELQKYLRRVRGLVGRDLIVTHGSQEAIFTAANVLLKPGDGVAVESLSYPSAIAALSSTGAILNGLPIDNDGVDPDGLARLCKKKRLKLLYLTPLHHYPTTVTLPSPRRLAIYEIAAKNGIWILEDDYDHEYHYRCQPLAPMAAEDPAEIVVYVSTLSKILFPSARLGFAAVPVSLKEKFALFRKMVTTQNDTLIQDAVARWMRTDGFQRHLNRTRRTYDKRLQGAVSTLEHYRSLGLPLSWTAPDGGMAIWLKTPWNTEQLLEAATREGIMIQSERLTRIDGRPGNHLRLGFARHTMEEQAAGLEKLFHLSKKLKHYSLNQV
ncbi:MAG: PLP-dependent aminotransferase family protein [Proteobacteria bacterium]|nr:PLP-dependent aminotransferase family protein [Pseudomonadota bacterium]